jgi:hypothetical protein
MWLPRPGLARSLFPVVVSLALVAIGFALAQAFEQNGRLRVNGGEIQTAVWELLAIGGIQPPECKPTTEDGIGE